MAKITKEQWIEIERRHLVDGESINSLAKEFGVNESSIRRKLCGKNAESKNGVNPLQALAFEKVRIETERRKNAEQIAELPIVRQMIVEDLATKLINISRHTASAAEYGAMTAHKLKGIANIHAQELDDENPSLEKLAIIGALTKLGNDAVAPALNLLAANKDRIKDADDQAEAEAALIQTIELVPLLQNDGG